MIQLALILLLVPSTFGATPESPKPGPAPFPRKVNLAPTRSIVTAPSPSPDPYLGFKPETDPVKRARKFSASELPGPHTQPDAMMQMQNKMNAMEQLRRQSQSPSLPLPSIAAPALQPTSFR